MADTKMAVVAFLLVSMLVFSAVPAATALGCIPDCVGRCSNGKNLVSCGTMCATACLKTGGGASSDSFEGN